MSDSLQQTIDAAWEDRNAIGPDTKGEVRQAVDKALAALDSGEARIAEKTDGEWTVHQWLKKAVLLSFRLNPMELISGAPGGANWWDKVPPSSLRWAKRISRLPASARFPARSSAVAPISLRAQC